MEAHYGFKDGSGDWFVIIDTDIGDCHYQSGNYYNAKLSYNINIVILHPLYYTLILYP